MPNMNVLGKRSTTVAKYDGVTRVTYHNTNVVVFDEKQIILNTDGFFTRTTMVRMNQASNQFNLGFRVFTKNQKWWVEYKDVLNCFVMNKFVIDR